MAIDWNDRTIMQLREMWEKGYTCSVIADALGGTRSAVAGKAQRLGLMMRGSPIGAARYEAKQQAREPYDRKKHARVDGRLGPRPTMRSAETWSAKNREPSLKFPSLKQGSHPAALAGSAERCAKQRAEIERPKPVEQPSLPLMMLVPQPKPNPNRKTGVPFADLEQDGCKWAITGHQVPVHAHRFCNAPREHGRSYCPSHVEKARGKRVEEAA